jgi:hypothetical protein
LRLAVQLCSHKTKLASFNGVYATPSAIDNAPALIKFGEDLRSAVVSREQKGSRRAAKRQSGQRGTGSAKDNMLFVELPDFVAPWR